MHICDMCRYSILVDNKPKCEKGLTPEICQKTVDKDFKFMNKKGKFIKNLRNISNNKRRNVNGRKSK